MSVPFCRSFRAEHWRDEDLRNLQNFLLAAPEAGDVIPGGSGLRKLRWSAQGRGKRGGARVIYYRHVPGERIYLIYTYAKSAQPDLTRHVVCPDSPKFQSGTFKAPTSPYAKLMRRNLPNSQIPNSHRFSEHTPRILEFYRKVQADKMFGRLPKSYLVAHGTKKDKKVLIDPGAPASTITTHPDEFIHFRTPRNITVREMARIQSFPDDFVFKGRYTINGPRRKQKLVGKPDFVFRKERVCLFVDGCFWHGCPKCYQRPGSHRAYWDAKVQRNRKRDLLVTRELRRAGWRVVRIWEHQLSEKHHCRLLRRFRLAFETESTSCI